MDHVLITERLILRPVTADDQDTLLDHWALPDVRRFLFDGAALSVAEVAATIEESVKDFAAAGYGIWLSTAPACPVRPSPSAVTDRLWSQRVSFGIEERSSLGFATAWYRVISQNRAIFAAYSR